MNKILNHFIERIAHLQSKGDAPFSAGLFPAQRVNPVIGYKRTDTTMFFSAIIAFTLQSIRSEAGSDQQDLIDGIIQRVVANYPDFRNKDGLETYNFWKTKPSGHFPNGHIFRRFEHFRIPDDIDDTAFAYLTTQPEKEDLLWLKNKLAEHANLSRQRIRNTYPEYQSLQAYSTWFGKNMYIEFDVSVLCNMLYCIYKYNLPLNQHDGDSLEYVRSVIETGRYTDVPFRCAHQYPRTPLIVYHVSRLIATFDPEQLRTIREKLISDAGKILSQTKNPMDRVILSISLLRLGEKTSRIPVENFTTNEFKGFYFFIAGLLTAYENAFLYKIAAIPIFHMHWICEAHNWTLLAEYEVLWNLAQNKSVSVS